MAKHRYDPLINHVEKCELEPESHVGLPAKVSFSVQWMYSSLPNMVINWAGNLISTQDYSGRS